MKYNCRDCHYSGIRSNFIEYITNIHDLDIEFFNNCNADVDKISTFCCGVPFSSAFRLNYQIFIMIRRNNKVLLTIYLEL